MRLFERFTKGIGLIIIVSLCLLAILMSFISREIPDPQVQEITSFASSFENKFYDFRMLKIIDQDPMNKNQDIVLVKIDDESLAKLNTWPIPRENWAYMLNNLKKLGARTVAFDVFFPEESQVCAGEVSADEILSQSIANYMSDEGFQVIIPYTVQSYNSKDMFEEAPGEMYDFILDSKQDSQFGLERKYVERQTFPIQKLLDATPDLAYINMLEDSDGVFRHYQLVSNVDDLYFPSIALRAFERISGVQTQLVINSHGNGHLKVKDQKVFVNHKGETKIRWFGNEFMFESISLYDVVKADPNDPKLKKLFDGKTVFVGSTATGAHDFRNSPLDAKMPGVVAHMNMLYMLQNMHFYQTIEDSIEISLYMMGIGLLLLLVVMHFGKPILDIISLLALISATYYIDYAYYLPYGYELKLFFVLLSFILTYSWITFLNFNEASKEKKQIKGAFSRFVAPSIVDDMLEHPEKLKVGGEKKDITCLFSDVRDFTSISEKLSAEDLASALNRYMGEMTDIVFETDGTLDKYIGDAIVAFWGAPLDIGDHVNKAMDASVKMLEALPAINEEFKEKGYPEFKIGLGLNSGECSVGNMGSDQIFAYTALGDNMNLGARLESLCKHYGAQILVSEYTYERMDHTRFTCRLIDKVRVKGKTEPVGVYEVLYSYHPFMIDKVSLEKFKKAYQDFLDKNFTQAKEAFEEILQKHPEDKASNRLKESCEHWIANPPSEDEDHSITTMTTK